MKKLSIFVLVLFLYGCAFHREFTATVEGDKVKTPWGTGEDITIKIVSDITIGK